MCVIENCISYCQYAHVAIVKEDLKLCQELRGILDRVIPAILENETDAGSIKLPVTYNEISLVCHNTVLLAYLNKLNDYLEFILACVNVSLAGV